MLPPSSAPRQQRMAILGLALSAVFLVGIAALLLIRTQLTTAAVPTPTVSEGVTPLDPPRTLSDFTLPGKDGSPLSLSDLRGKYTLLFFGYTNCPDYCPLTLANFKRIKNELGSQADQVQFLLVSVDGARDTPDVLKEYLDRFDSTFYGMQGDEATLARIAPEYGLYYELQKTSPDDTNYSVDHTTQSYLIDPSGNMVAAISFSAEVPIIVDTIRAHLNP